MSHLTYGSVSLGDAAQKAESAVLRLDTPNRQPHLIGPGQVSKLTLVEGVIISVIEFFVV